MFSINLNDYDILCYLKTDDICTVLSDFFYDGLFPILPVEGPGRTVPVELPGAVLITQHIVAHHSIDCCKIQSFTFYFNIIMLSQQENCKAIILQATLPVSYLCKVKS